jgi:GNAT superfamily N-acetyltransferase
MGRTDPGPSGIVGIVYRFRPCRDDAEAMVAVRRGCLERDGLDADSVVEKMPTPEEVTAGEGNQILVEHNGNVVGYETVSWWRERDGTWLYLHRGHLLPRHRGRGVGTEMLAWAEGHIRELVKQQGTQDTAVFGASAAATEHEATALLLDNGYHRVFSLVELEMPDLRALPETRKPVGIRLGPIDESGYHAVWKTVVDSYTGADAIPDWTFESFRARPIRRAGGRPTTTTRSEASPCASSAATTSERSKNSVWMRTSESRESAEPCCWTASAAFKSTERPRAASTPARPTRTAPTTSTRASASNG